MATIATHLPGNPRRAIGERAVWMTSEARAERLIGRVVRTVEYNTDNGSPEAIDAAHIRVRLCANGSTRWQRSPLRSAPGSSGAKTAL